MRRSDDPSRYDDIIHLPHPTSARHPRMSVYNRAAQFSPFSALTGYEELVDETARLTESRGELDEQRKSILDGQLRLLLEHIDETPEVNITHYVPDLKKYGGQYTSHRGHLRRIDSFERSILFTDGLKLSIDDIYDIDSPLFYELQV